MSIKLKQLLQSKAPDFLTTEHRSELCSRCESINWGEAEASASASRYGYTPILTFKSPGSSELEPSSCAFCRIVALQINAYLRKRLSWNLVPDPSKKPPSSDETLCLFIFDISVRDDWVMFKPTRANLLADTIRCQWSQGEKYILFVERCNIDSYFPGERCPLKHYVLKSSYTVIQPESDNSNIMTTIAPDSINYHTVKEWLRLCSQDHGYQCTPGTSKLPTGFRLIDCMERKVVDIDTTGTAPEYIALSYVWGRASWHISPFSSVSPGLTNLPPVIEDSLTVTLNLGFRYLWVDRYCIAEDAHDIKMAQIYSMDAIYSSAQATIIAAVGDSPSVRLPGVGIKRFNHPTARAQDRRFIWSMNPSSDLINISAWNTRGWTLQEALLSHRRIVITNEQVYFQCRQRCSCESYPAMRNPDAPLSPLEQFYDFVFLTQSFSEVDSLETALRDFIRRRLSYSADILNAFRGIMKQYEQSSGMYSLYGMPILPQLECPGVLRFQTLDLANFGMEQRFVIALTWNSKHDSNGKWTKGGLDGYGQDLLRRDGFPSWSWTGWMWPAERLYTDFLGSVYCPAVEATIYGTGGDRLAWDRAQLRHGFVDDRHVSSTITIHAWAFAIRLGRSDSRFSPKGKKYDTYVDARPFPDNNRFNQYKGKWSWKTADHTAVYFGPLTGSSAKPEPIYNTPRVFFMLVKERADGKWERVGDGEGNWFDTQDFFGWGGQLREIPGVFERRRFDIC